MNDLVERISPFFDEPPNGLHELDGGEIGTVYRLDFDARAPVVAKTSDTPLTIEASMLRHLDDNGLPVPEVHRATDDLLLLEYVEGESTITPEVERAIAGHLVSLHDVSASAYGFERDTLTGSLRQPNPWTDSWVEFYREHRLRYAAEVTRKAGELPAETFERVETLADDLDSLLVEPDSPSLIHGDVWTTNLLASGGGPCVPSSTRRPTTPIPKSNSHT